MSTNPKVVCLDKFIKEIKDELSVSCQIPINVSTKEVMRIIDKAKSWFYKNYEDSVEDQYFIIEKEYWDTDTFRSTGTVILPDTIFSVNSVYEIGREMLGTWGKKADLDKDFAMDKFIYSDMYKPNYQSESLMYYVINEAFYDMARQMLVNKVGFRYNRLSNKLFFTGEKPDQEVVLDIYSKIEDCHLFKDEIFFRYVAANAKIQVSRVLGTFNYQLPGNITIQYDLIRDEGKEELDYIRETIKEEDSADYFITS